MPKILTETIKSWSKREKNTTDHVQVAYLVVVGADLRPKDEEIEKTHSSKRVILLKNEE